MSNDIISITAQHKVISPSQERKIAYLKKIIGIIVNHNIEEESLTSLNLWIEKINRSSSSELDVNLQKGTDQIKHLIEKEFRFVLIKKKRIMLFKRFVITCAVSGIVGIIQWRWGDVFLLLLYKPVAIILLVTYLEWIEKKPLKLFQLQY